MHIQTRLCVRSNVLYDVHLLNAPFELHSYRFKVFWFILFGQCIGWILSKWSTEQWAVTVNLDSSRAAKFCSFLLYASIRKARNNPSARQQRPVIEWSATSPRMEHDICDAHFLVSLFIHKKTEFVYYINDRKWTMKRITYIEIKMNKIIVNYIICAVSEQMRMAWHDQVCSIVSFKDFIIALGIVFVLIASHRHSIVK